MSIMVPIYKKGDPSNIENYRGISLLSTAYKIYAGILRDRLEKEAEVKNMLLKSQAGFRKGRCTTDNVFIITHVIQRGKILKR